MPEVGGVDLSKKIGPVPIWVIVAAGGLGIAYFVNRGFLGGGGGGGGAPAATVVEPGVGGTPGGFVPAPSPDEETGPVGPVDNEAWAVAATTWLITNGYSGLKAGIAVRKYLDGELLSSEEAVMIDRVTKELGVPPNVPTGGGIEQPPPAPPAANPGPTGVKAEALSGTKIRLTWTKQPGALLYQVQRIGGGAVVTVTNSYTSSKPLAPSTTYQYHVRSVKADGTTAWSPPVTVRTKAK